MRPPEQRPAFLLASCPDQTTLRLEVEDLLRHDAAGDLDLHPPLGPVLGHLGPVLRREPPVAAFPRRLGRYRVLGELGRGAMGVVYRAEQDAPNREVALKLMLIDATLPQHRLAAVAEADALARLRHPGIVPVFDAGVLDVDGVAYPFLAMELVEGMPLRVWRDVQRPSVAERVRLLVAVCEATEAAHRRGVIHCDLKPDHILVETDGGVPRPRILDFGVARLIARADVQPGLAGTLPYMSPEQLAGDGDVDTRTDVYSLGVVAFELLTGATPHMLAGMALEDVRRQVAAGPPPAALAALGRDLGPVVGTALAPDRSSRYASAGALAADLERWLRREPVSVVRHTPWYLAHCFARRRRAICGLLVLSVLAMGVAFAVVVASLARTDAALDRLVGTSRFAVEQIVGRLATLSGTREVRAETLQRFLPEVEEMLQGRPGDPTILACRAAICRQLGDLAHFRERFEEALSWRRRALADSSVILATRPDDAALRAREATDLVLVGDVLRQLSGPGAALAAYQRAHAVFLELADEEPRDGGRLDDVAWSCDRMAFVAVEEGRAADAEAFLDQREALLHELETVRPGSIHNLAGWRSLYGLRSHLERARGRMDQCEAWILKAVLPARERMQREPHDVGAVLEFGNMVMALGECRRERGAPMDAELAAWAREALAAAERLAAYEPDVWELRNQCEKLGRLAADRR